MSKKPIKKFFDIHLVPKIFQKPQKIELSFFDVRGKSYSIPVEEKLNADIKEKYESYGPAKNKKRLIIRPKYKKGTRFIKVKPSTVSSPSKKRKFIDIFSFNKKPPIFHSRSQINLVFPKKFVINKSILVFVVICLLIYSSFGIFNLYGDVINKKENIYSQADLAYSHLEQAKNNIEGLRLNMAQEEFAEAENIFESIHKQIQKVENDFSYLVKILPQGKKIKSGKHLVKAGEKLSSMGYHLSLGLNPVLSSPYVPLAFSSENEELVLGERDPTVLGASTKEMEFSEFIASCEENLSISLNYLSGIQGELSQVDARDLPEDIREQVVTLQEELPRLRKSLLFVKDFSEVFSEVLGREEPKFFLLIFQNNAQMRATGGFIGTYGELRTENFQIKELKVDNIYNPSHLVDTKIVPPPPIARVNDKWMLQDANWFLDFPLSAKKISWMYEHCGRQKPDGMIAITPQVAIELLKVTGEIYLPELDLTIDSENFVKETLHMDPELVRDKEDLLRHKKIISLLAPRLVKKFKEISSARWVDVVDNFIELMQKKHILFFFENQEIQDKARLLGIAGEVKEAPKDYLNVVQTNIGGMKNDLMIEEKIEHKVQIADNGEIINEVTVIRENAGDPGWPNGRNLHYMRIFVPKGSTLISAEGFSEISYKDARDKLSVAEFEYYVQDPDLEKIFGNVKKDLESDTDIFEESGYTVFGNWLELNVEEIKRVTVRYELPFILNLNNEKPVDSYSLVIQKQPGRDNVVFESNISYPRDWEVLWKSSDVEKKSDNEVYYKGVLDTDKVFGFVVGR